MNLRLPGPLGRIPVETPLFIGLGSIALAMSFSVTESVMFTALSVLVIWSGRGVVRLLVPTSLGPYLELALAILFSSLLATFLFQFARTTEFPVPLTVGGLVLVGVFGSLRKGPLVDRLDLDRQFDILAMVLLVRGLQGATWLLGCVVVMYLVRRVLRDGPVAPESDVLLWLGTCVVFAASLLLRHIQFWWWYPSSNDAQFFESMSHSLSNFGPFEHPGVLGNSLLGYHWFVYGWTGVISELVGAKTWHASTIFAPVLLTVVAIALIQALLSRVVSEDTKWIRYAATASVALYAPTFALSSWFGNLWILAIVVVVLARPKYELLSAPMLVILLGVGAVFAKGTNVVLLPIIAVVAFLAWRFSSQRSENKRTLAALIAASAVGAVYFTSGIGSDFISSNRTICGVDQFFLCTRESLFQRVEPIVYAALLIGISSTHRAIARSRPLLASGSFFAIILLVAVAVFPVSGDFVNYLIHSLEFLVFITLVVVLSERVQEVSNRGYLSRGLKVLVSAAAIAGFIGSIGEFASRTSAVRGFVTRYFSGQLERLVFNIYPAHWKAIATLLLLLAVVASAKLVRSNADGLRGLVGALVALTFVAGIAIGESSGRYWIGSDAFTQSEDNSAPMATDDLVAVADFVAKETASDFVLATNNFCCEGSEWVKFEVDEVLNDNQRLYESWPTKFGGANYLIAAESERRMLVSGLRFVVPSLITDEVVKKLKASVEFANSPSLQEMRELCDFGADGAVINLKLADVESWVGPGTIEFASGDFVFVNFRQCNN